MAAAARPVDFASGNHYHVLGVPRGACELEITHAYKDLARQYHPDKHPHKQAEAEVSFKRIAEAYSVLRDPAKRHAYDRSGQHRSYVDYAEAEKMWRAVAGAGAAAGGPGSARGAAGPRALFRRRRACSVLATLAVFVAAPSVLAPLLPLVAAALVLAALFSRRGRSSTWAWYALVLLLGGHFAPRALRAHSNLSAVPANGPDPSRGAADRRIQMITVPHSGEEVMVNGTFMRMPDPMNRDGHSIHEGWEQRLLETMSRVIATGQEQVVTVFARQGCPWCDKLVPVLHRAIQRRIAEAAGDQDDRPAHSDGKAAAGGGPRRAAGSAPPSGSGNVPLRIFVLDAAEFPTFIRTYRIQSFPTILAWGPPGAVPMVAPGFLDDQTFDGLLRTMAAASPEGGKKRQGRLRGLFR
mmetsp:Transcript_120661/g.341843  ORF Transcript_120661/g.341843 Transcript_120661/m.341843 type:complete len:410 (-) Transcript_120661:95-1324(-)